MLRKRLKSLLWGESRRPQPVSAGIAGPTATESPLGRAPELQVYSRHSHGLEQFFGNVQDRQGLSILDLAGATQTNVAFITNLGHRLHSVDLFRALSETFAGESGDMLSGQEDLGQVEAFLEQNLDFPEGSLDGVLVWDCLEYLSPPLLKKTVNRLHRILKPRCYLLAFFHADERAQAVPAYSYRISDSKTLLLSPRGLRRPAQLFNNRSIERLFQQFSGVKFFLARDNLREVIATR